MFRGNYISEYPYTKGPACSKCLQKQSCENNLCTGKNERPVALQKISFAYLMNSLKKKTPFTLFLGEGVEVCENLDDDCEYWSSAGECQNNPNFMLKKCRKACGVCQG